mmetsp:Transcript_14482/g.31605  ORF Transcript_14482/g.31605 Transcript_14482/m.31605 type:complete len:224 (-) Transcript_14482:135-806(-)
MTSGGARVQGLLQSFGRRTVPLESTLELVLDGEGFDGETHDSVSTFVLVVVNININMIVNVGQFVVCGHETHGETSSIAFSALALLTHTNGSRWEVINDPIIVVSVLDVQQHFGSLDFSHGHLTQFRAVHFGEHVNAVGRALDLVACQEFTQVLRGLLGTSLGLAKGKAVEITGNLSLGRSQSVDLERDFFSFLERQRSHTWNVEGLCCGHRHAEQQDREGTC